MVIIHLTVNESKSNGIHVQQCITNIITKQQLNVFLEWMKISYSQIISSAFSFSPPIHLLSKMFDGNYYYVIAHIHLAILF